MKFTIVCLFATVAVALAQQYTGRYDDINLQEIVDNPRLFNSYIQCLLDNGPAKCTPEGKELKNNMQDALETGCDKCTKKQKEGSEFIMSHLINHRPEDWAKLTAKFDPSGKYAKKYEKEYKKIKA